MNKPAIDVRSIGKRYQIGALQEPYLSLRDSLVRKTTHLWNVLCGREHIRQAKDDFWALKDVSFTVNTGEAVGIIGRNGAGKSTLLKILSQITPPTEGSITLQGRVASLLEVGTGFHPELSGRENIYLNGAILGMSRNEIRQKFDDIVTFAEVEKFLDTPVKRYSSGMYVRLAFAVAAHLEPEILVVDEVLAVGDVQFQKKCLGKMQDVAKGGRTVLFVSHNMAAIEGLCSKAVLLENGRLIQQGSTSSVINYYLKELMPNVIAEGNVRDRKNRKGNGKIRIIDFWIEDAAGNQVNGVSSGSDCTIAIKYKVHSKNTRNVDVGISLNSPIGVHLTQLYSSYTGYIYNNIPNCGVFLCRIPNLPLGPNRYTIVVSILENGTLSDYLIGGVGYLNVEAGDFYGTGRGVYHPNIPLLINGCWGISEQMTSDSSLEES